MRASSSSGRPLIVFLGLAVFLLVLDQVTKLLALRSLPANQPVPLFGTWIRLTLTHNTGSAFGIIRSGWILLAAGIVVCIAILLYVSICRGLTRHPEQAAALGLVLGGSLGNLSDRVRFRAVVDFIDLRWWPVFNVADIGITVGFVLLVGRLILRR